MSAPPRIEPPELSALALVIDTPRLTLRPLATSDVDAIWPLARDPELSRNLSWEPHVDREETAAFIAGKIGELAAGTSATWAIVPRAGDRAGQLSGVVSLDAIRWQFRAWRMDRAALGYWLAPALWNQGLMSEAALAATRWGFETLGLHKIVVSCVDGNVGSQRVIEKIGFRFLALYLEDFYRHGRWHDHRFYELTAAEWADSARTGRFTRMPRP